MEYNSNCVTYYYKTVYNIVYKVTVHNLILYLIIYYEIFI